MEEGTRSAVLYRPEAYDLVVYLPRTGALGIHAKSKGEKDLYREKFGLHLFGNGRLFSEVGRYTLEPLRGLGRDSLECQDVDALAAVRLTEIRFFHSKAAQHSEVRQASDVFSVYRPEGDLKFPSARARIQMAKLKVEFSDSKKTRTLVIRPPSVAQYTRDSDALILEDWMALRGFVRPPADGKT
jgi:hypothetical protein